MFVPFHKGNGTSGTFGTSYKVNTVRFVPFVPLVPHKGWNGTEQDSHLDAQLYNRFTIPKHQTLPL